MQIPLQRSLDAVREALRAVDSVHGDGDLPRLEIRLGRGKKEIGGYVYARDGSPRRIVVSRHSDHPRLSFVHELGHFLDHQGLGIPGRFASEAGRLAEVMSVIERSHAIVALRSLRGRRRAIVTRRDGRRELHTLRARHIDYLLQPRELFARAYAQYIAVRNADVTLLIELDVIRRDLLASQVYHDQWTDDDFAPIGEALDGLLRRLGWMR